jgi:hypothetical protein
MLLSGLQIYLFRVIADIAKAVYSSVATTFPSEGLGYGSSVKLAIR